ncbi:unnamed protein product [Brachionus calyciflorus]|uniref:Uncharacterized protein n=1 Tax=Brachionus calyciflorus TaxID=104777 RepID=A0A813N2H0_9BILA|nr:unnamed protein product [Brachionus calyciflorus]
MSLFPNQITGFQVPATMPYSFKLAGFVPPKFISSPPGTYLAKYEGFVYEITTIEMFIPRPLSHTFPNPFIGYGIFFTNYGGAYPGATSGQFPGSF